MKVALRKKKLARSRESLYLDIYHHGKRSYEFLELYFEPGQTRDERDEVRRIAERINTNIYEIFETDAIIYFHS